ncbi:hypothetical protein B9Z55_018303 [Caenorhabditis nigoni]|uniref:Pre-mRNA-splicing factor 38 n=1 Tax=Caenorhabditis nigoni TaxID=1611254 RepID=A0A2G5TD90_9PELO|nr:hypothetical protein B9Z55_018303 [Caenorhabditis nigoni]
MFSSKQSVYIRAIGFIYIRYTQPPEDLWNWLKYLPAAVVTVFATTAKPSRTAKQPTRRRRVAVLCRRAKPSPKIDSSARIQPQSEDRTVQSDQQGQQHVQLADAQEPDHPDNDAGTFLQSVQRGQQQVQQAGSANHQNLEVCKDVECTCVSFRGHQVRIEHRQTNF